MNTYWGKASARVVLLLSTLMVVSNVNAWWNEEWQFRKSLTVMTPAAVTTDVEFVPVLLRLHVGNFGYFGDTAPDGADIRFVAADDLTVYKHYNESYDPVAFLANIWVMVPRVTSAAPLEVSMYYGNPAATNASDAAFFGVEQAMVLHFDGQGNVLNDATAYQQSLTSSSDLHFADALISGGLNFAGTTDVAQGTLSARPLSAETGFSVSAWIKPEEIESGIVWELSNTVGDSLSLALSNSSILLNSTTQDGAGQISSPSAPGLGSWQHVAVAADSQETRLYINGALAASALIALPAMLDQLVVGGDIDASYSGVLDELSVSTVAYPGERFAMLASIEGVGSTAIGYGGDQSNDEAEGGGHPNYFLITLQNVTFDGWVVIVFLFVMALISWVIMIVKALQIRSARKDNASFLKDFYASDLDDLESLDRDEDGDLVNEGGVLNALGGPSDHYQRSTIYHLYHAGVQEVKRRLQGATAGAQYNAILAPESVDAIRATLDANMVREIQRLNSMMVMLTIAIAGGPFLGLLGTVVGVMITFAAIAASGDVNVNAIAPGIAAALAATVAGLAVAIPALFAYNYFATRIKEIVADMRVFLDEFVTRIAEQYRGA